MNFHPPPKKMEKSECLRRIAIQENLQSIGIDDLEKKMSDQKIFFFFWGDSF
jgi:hypothetical protein